VIGLGAHLVDLALWALDFPEVTSVSSQLLAGGEPLSDPAAQVEDYAIATLGLASGAAVQLACSWRLQAGRKAEISASYSTAGGAALSNVNFTARRCRGTQRETLTSPPDEWGGRAAADWAVRLGRGERFDPASERLVEVAQVLDRVYGRET
jgi:predicted dehydrogenase